MKGFDNKQKIKALLQPNEQVLWEGAPHALFFILNANHIPSLVGLVIMIVGFVVAAQQNMGGLFVILIGMLATLAVPAYRFLQRQTIHYLVTDSRVLLVEGFMGESPTVLMMSGLTKLSVNNNFIETITGAVAGTVVLTPAPAPGQIVFGALPQIKLKNILHPREVSKYIKVPQQNAQTVAIPMPGFPPTEVPTVDTTQTVTTTYQSTSSTTDYSS